MAAAKPSACRPGGPLMSTGKDDWRTPLRVLAPLGTVHLDPCAAPDPRHHFAKVNWTERDDGLSRSWRCGGTVFVNPPYSAIKPWMSKCLEQAREDVEVVALVPARTETTALQASLRQCQAVCWLSGRLRFFDGDQPAKHSAPFPSVLIYWGARSLDFSRAYRQEGVIMDRARGWVSWQAA